VLGDPGLGEEAGAGAAAAGDAVAGGEAAGGEALVGAVSGGVGLVAPPPDGGGFGLPGSAGMERFFFCASGMTKGPFWPQARSAPAQTITINCENFMSASIPAPPHQFARNFCQRLPVKCVN
jgi:hypothetical protein